MIRVFITGVAGFIGFHLAKFILEKPENPYKIFGIDNMNAYYDPDLKKERLKVLGSFTQFKFFKTDLVHFEDMTNIIEKTRPHIIIHLAAQAGVRYGFKNPSAYVDSNLVGFVHLLEAVKELDSLEHLIYASSSSVYGNSKTTPFKESNSTDKPISLYAATKKANEVIAESYSHNFSLKMTCLRFFTVYGILGRPDMAYFSFTKNIFSGDVIHLFGKGLMKRDFTYVGDVVKCISLMLNKGFIQKTNSLHNIYNIGNSKPVLLEDFVSLLEKFIGKQANKNYLEKPPGDVDLTYACTAELEKDYSYEPSTPLEDGLREFVTWYRAFYKLS